MVSLNPLAELRTQEFLDAICERDLPHSVKEWYNVDISTILDTNPLFGHEINEENRSTLLFLQRSLLMCDPSTGKIHHYPKSLIHCFIDDLRRNPSRSDDEPLFRVELFSISPSHEQLAWEIECWDERDIPSAEESVARWLNWLNKTD